MTERNSKANHDDESKYSSHKPGVNLRQVDDTLNGNDIDPLLETLSTFGIPTSVTTINLKVKVTNLPSGVMTNAAGSLADASAGLGKHTTNNVINLSEKEMNIIIETSLLNTPLLENKHMLHIDLNGASTSYNSIMEKIQDVDRDLLLIGT
ncbi:hypothetical protein DSO57_1024030 [Entomophthora muscae]|uniref:Uncharacterized protein n=1 Tax=Entomophthora muscae TaxID=34485 RepID=A0ACC2UBR1_9FUNG|nr:hypothetical protein DSO57_1024030 [Entomophthora muscae]